MRSILRGGRLLALVASLVLLCAALVRAQGKFKNLQVLPQDIDKAKLKAIMKAQAKALGVECDYCHTQPNMEVDTEHKKIAREMMRLVDEINAGKFKPDAKVTGSKALTKARQFYQKYLPGRQDITCMTCHEGKEEPVEPKTAK